MNASQTAETRFRRTAPALRAAGFLLLLTLGLLTAPTDSHLAVQSFKVLQGVSAVHFLGAHGRGLLLDGPAVVSFADGSCWSGSFAAGRPEGAGTWVLPDGHAYAGTFAGREPADGEAGGVTRFVLSGRVLLTFADGAAFVGEFAADTPQGEGEYVTPQGASYRGGFAYDRPSGQGRYACLQPPAPVRPLAGMSSTASLTPSRGPDERLIVVSIRDCRLYLLRQKGGTREIEREYAVATVKRGLETPLGEGRVTGVDLDPWWYPTARTRAFFRERKNVHLPEAVPPDDPRNFMGSFKIRLSHATSRGTIYRIHGNNDPALIGARATGGCIRMDNAEGEALARAIAVGTKVIIEERADVRDYLRSAGGRAG